MGRSRGWRRFASLLCALGALSAQETFSVEGHVVNSVTHADIAGVALRIWDTRAGNYPATTDSTGAFRIDGMKAGVYLYSFEKSGYISLQMRDSSKGLRVGASRGPLRLDIELTPTATITGRVLDDEGKPVAKAAVFAGDSKNAQTGDEGQFSLENIEPGSYTLLAKPPAGASVAPSAEGERISVLPTYFPSTLDRVQAEPVIVQGGTTLSGYDIRLRSARVYRVRGVVIDPAGQPANSATVSLTRRGEQAGTLAKFFFGSVTQYIAGTSATLPEAQMVTKEDGTFEFASVRAGEWSLSVDAPGAADNATHQPMRLRGVENISIERDDFDHAEVRLAAPFDLPVATDWGDIAFADRRQSAVLALTNGENQLTLLFLSQPMVPILPGRYRIAGGPPLNHNILTSVLLDGRDVLGQYVDLQPGAGPLTAVYKRTNTSLRGSVDKGSGSTILVWQPTTDGPTLLNAIAVGANGNFEGIVAPGQYYVVAVDHADTHTIADSGFMARLTGYAQSVSVEEGAAAVVQLPLTPWPQ